MNSGLRLPYGMSVMCIDILKTLQATEECTCRKTLRFTLKSHRYAKNDDPLLCYAYAQDSRVSVV